MSMTNIEKYNNLFIEIFSTSESELNALFTNKNVACWDSVRHLSMITAIEETFDIMFDTEDILGFTSYCVGKEILSQKYGINF